MHPLHHPSTVFRPTGVAGGPISASTTAAWMPVAKAPVRNERREMSDGRRHRASRPRASHKRSRVAYPQRRAGRGRVRGRVPAGLLHGVPPGGGDSIEHGTRPQRRLPSLPGGARGRESRDRYVIALAEKVPPPTAVVPVTSCGRLGGPMPWNQVSRHELMDDASTGSRRADGVRGPVNAYHPPDYPLGGRLVNQWVGLWPVQGR